MFKTYAAAYEKKCLTVDDKCIGYKTNTQPPHTNIDKMSNRYETKHSINEMGRTNPYVKTSLSTDEGNTGY